MTALRHPGWRWWLGRAPLAACLGWFMHLVLGDSSPGKLGGETLAFLLIWWGIRIGLERRVRRRPSWGDIGFTEGAELAFCLAVAALLALLVLGFRANPQRTLGFGLGLGIVAFMVLVEHTFLLRELDRYRARAVESTLRAKLAPHFIFNTLNTLEAQIGRDPREAQALAGRLGSLFRRALEMADLATVPLAQELAFVEDYLGIERARMGERLRVRVEVPEAAEDLELPPLSLQVLVENAVKHGVAPLEAGGEVVVGARVEARYDAFRESRDLVVWVEDPGPGTRSASPHRGTGTALETLRQRLLQPEDLEMTLERGRHRVAFRWRQP